MKKQFAGSIYILIATVIWGSAFVAQSVGMDYIGPFTFQAVRCGLAVIGLIPVIWIADLPKKDGKTFLQRWMNKKLWICSLCCAIPLFFAINLQQIGLVDTDAGKSGFLTAMYIVLVPVIGFFLGQKTSPWIPVSVVLAVIGLYLLSCAGVTQVSTSDLLLLGCALMFAIQIVCIDRMAQDLDALRVNCLQALFCSIGSAAVMFFTETPTAANLLDCALPLCYTGFLSMGVAYSLQILGQKALEPSAASLLMSMESVFAVISGWLILGERLTPYEGAGCILVFIAVILSQLPSKKGGVLQNS